MDGSRLAAGAYFPLRIQITMSNLTDLVAAYRTYQSQTSLENALNLMRKLRSCRKISDAGTVCDIVLSEILRIATPQARTTGRRRALGVRADPGIETTGFFTAVSRRGLGSFQKRIAGEHEESVNWNSPDYFCTVNGVENAVLSHIIFNAPPPEGFFEMAIVN